MERRTIAPRRDWINRVESQGLIYHTAEGEPYWDESAYYLFTADEVDELEEATNTLQDMCLEAVAHVLDRGLLGVFEIPQPYWDFVRKSWEDDEFSLYGRFDLAYDGVGPPKLLEYNADTPTSLLEAAVIQWQWLEDQKRPIGELGAMASRLDQFNSIHECLIETWSEGLKPLGGSVAFAAVGDSVEDQMTAGYLRDTAMQAGFRTQSLSIDQIGWDARRRWFVDLDNRPIEAMFKLYPWEWLIREAFGPNLLYRAIRWVEPPWKMVLSNKAILPVLYELFPDSPYLLPAAYQPVGDSFVVKPILGREGSNVTIVRRGDVVARSGGFYGDQPCVYQKYRELPKFDGRSAVIGSWVVGGRSCGMGIREDEGPITGNTSRFVPHAFLTR